MVALPTESSLLFPTLAAVQALGGSAHKDDIEREVVRSQGFSDEQLAEEFPPTATRRGSILLVRIAFARTSLKKIKALDNAKTGVWTITDRGERFLREGPAAVVAADKEVRRNRSRGMPEPDLAPATTVGATSKRPGLGDAVRAALQAEFGALRSGSKALSSSATAQFDAISGDGNTIIEFLEHEGPTLGAHLDAVASAAFKVSSFLNAGLARNGILVFIDSTAASTVSDPTTWLGAAIRSAGIEVRVVALDPE